MHSRILAVIDRDHHQHQHHQDQVEENEERNSKCFLKFFAVPQSLIRPPPAYFSFCPTPQFQYQMQRQRRRQRQGQRQRQMFFSIFFLLNNL